MVTIRTKFFSITTILWAIALLSATLLPGNDLPEMSVKLNDKMIHTIMYLILTTLFFNAGWREGFLGLIRKKMILVGVLSSVVIAIGTEFLQALIPGRNLSFYDMIANVVGIVFGVVLFLITRNRFK